jgi:hypothetical protein
MKKLLLLFLLYAFAAAAQTYTDTVYTVEVNASVSPLLSIFREERYQGNESRSAPGYSYSLRSMWHPGRMLSVGIMLGYTSISRDESEMTYVHLAAIPLQVVVSMQANGIEVGVGMGPYLMISTIDGPDAVSIGRRSELGLTFMGSYIFKLSNYFSAGPELKVLYLSYRGIIAIMPSLTLQLKALRY